MAAIKPVTTIDNFESIDIRVGTVLEAELVLNSKKLIRLVVDFGTELGKKQILTGLAQWFTPQDFVGLQSTFVLNFPPRKMAGLDSEGMIVAIGLDDTKKPVLLAPLGGAENGDGVR